MSELAYLHEEIAFRKQEAYEILSASYNDEQIKELCRRFSSSRRPDLLRKKLDKIAFFATAALVSYMSLQVKIPPPGQGYMISDEDMANIVLDALNASLCLVEAGWLPGERYIKTRLKQIRNQPKTRKRKNEAKDNIKDSLEEYKEKKGCYPKNFQNFLAFLKAAGTYVIDERIDCPGDCDKTVSLGTVQNWFREYIKQNDSSANK